MANFNVILVFFFKLAAVITRQEDDLCIDKIRHWPHNDEITLCKTEH